MSPLRLVLPIVAVLALMAQSITTWAGAGFVTEEIACCCPDPDTCPCHDHDGTPDPGPTMKRCSGDAQLVVPVQLVAVSPEVPTAVDARPQPAVEPSPIPIPESRDVPPIVPPF